MFPQVRWEECRRGLCILDPNGLHLSSDVMKVAGEMRSIDLLLNSPTMDINMNAVRRYPERVVNHTIAKAFRARLREVAGFGHVPAPLPMRNSRNAVVYYLFFASHNATGAKIAKQIFDKFRTR